jgi:hypothetical protein
MSNSIEKFKQEELVAATYWKNRGSIAKTAAELDLDLKYVERIARKMKKAVKFTVNHELAFMIYSNFWLTHQQSIQVLTDKVIHLESQTEKEVSTCCNKPVRIGTVGEEERTMCTHCSSVATTHIVQDIEIHKLVLKYQEQIRREQELLLDSAMKLGFTTGANPQINQTIFAIQDNSSHIDKSKHLTIDPETAKQVDELSGQEQMRLAKRLEQSIIEQDEDASEQQEEN